MGTCNDINPMIPDFLTGELPPQEVLSVQAHMVECVRCREEIAGLVETWAQLGVLDDPKPSEALRQGFYAMLARESDGQKVQVPPVPDSASRRHPRFWMAAAASLVIGLSGYTLGRWVQPNPGATQVAEFEDSEGDLSLLRSISARDRMVGIAMVSQSRRVDPSMAEALLNLLDRDPDVQVRLTAVEALYLFGKQPEVQERIIASLNKQTSPIVQEALIGLIVGLREKRAIEALHALLQDRHLSPEVRQQAEASLAALRNRSL